jgi:Brp/Blh family beta-carotene 15,15'-monooxygenase
MKRLIVKNYQNFKIFFTFLLFWVSIQFGEVVEDSIAYFLVITIGVLHGANDLIILSKSNRSKKNVLFKYLVIYLSIIFACILIYFISAFVSILFFILISAYHFGEEYFSDELDTKKFFNQVYFLVYGLVIFSMLFFNSKADVDEIMFDLVGKSFRDVEIKFSLTASSILLVVLSVYNYFKNRMQLRNLIKEVFFLFFLFLVFKTTSLILGFAVYFILWHSLPSIIHQILFISTDFSKKSIILYLKKAFLYWLISAISIFLLYVFLPDIKLFASILFVILFAVTAPHMWVMHKMKTSE